MPLSAATVRSRQRPFLVFDENGVAAFRHLVASFAAAGNRAARAIAYAFTDVLRTGAPSA
jgi:hypothetical protein